MAPKLFGACSLLRAHTIGDLDTQPHATPSVLDCVRLDFGNHPCLPSGCEHVRLAVLRPTKLALDHSWGPPFRRSNGWHCAGVAYGASATRRTPPRIAHGRLSTVGVRTAVHLAGLLSAPAAAYLTQPIRGRYCRSSAVFDRTPP